MVTNNGQTMQYLTNASQNSQSNNNILINVLTAPGQQIQRPQTGAQQSRGRKQITEQSMFHKSYTIMMQQEGESNDRVLTSAAETIKVNPSMVNFIDPIQEVTPTRKSGKKFKGNASIRQQIQTISYQGAVQQVMQQTLTTQTNCFLPNFKKNHMMRRYEDQFGTYYVGNDTHSHQQNQTPNNDAFKRKKSKKLSQRQPKKVDLNVTHESGLVFQLQNPATSQISLKQINARTMNNSSADLKNVMATQDDKVIRIQQPKLEVASPKRTVIQTKQNRIDSNQTISGQITPHILGPVGSGTAFHTSNIRVPLNGDGCSDSPDQLGPSLSVGLQPLYPGANGTNQIDSNTFNGSSSQNQLYVQQQKLIDSQTFQMLQEQVSLSKFSGDLLTKGQINQANGEVEGRAFEDSPLLHLEERLNSRQQIIDDRHFWRPNNQEGIINNEVPSPLIVASDNPLIEYSQDIIQEPQLVGLRMRSNMEIASDPDNLMMQDKSELSRRFKAQNKEEEEMGKSRQLLRLGKNGTKQTHNKTQLSNNSREMRKSADNDWKVLNVGIFNINLTTDDVQNHSGNKKGCRLNETGGLPVVRTPPLSSNQASNLIVQRPRSGSTLGHKRALTPNQGQNRTIDQGSTKEIDLASLQITNISPSKVKDVRNNQGITGPANNEEIFVLPGIHLQQSNIEVGGKSQNSFKPNKSGIITTPVDNQAVNTIPNEFIVGRKRDSQSECHTLLQHHANYNKNNGDNLSQQSSRFGGDGVAEDHLARQERISFGIKVYSHSKSQIKIQSKSTTKQQSTSRKNNSSINIHRKSGQLANKKKQGSQAEIQQKAGLHSLRPVAEQQQLKIEQAMTVTQANFRHHMRNEGGGLGRLKVAEVHNEQVVQQFDSAATVESHQQKINYFENRYQTEEDQESPQVILKKNPSQPSFNQPINTQSSGQGFPLYLHPQISVGSSQQVVPHFNSPLVKPIYTLSDDGTYVLMQQVEGSEVIETYMPNGVEEFARSGSPQRRQVANKYIKVMHQVEGDVTQNQHMRNNQIQVTMNDLTEDLTQNLLLLNQNVIISDQNEQQVNTNMTVSTLQNQPLTAVAHDSFRNLNQYSGPNLFLNAQTFPSGLVLQGSVNNIIADDRSSSGIRITNFIEGNEAAVSHQALNQKTLQQFIMAKRQDQIVKTIDPKAPSLHPYQTHHLRKQEDEERARELSQQVKQRQELMQSMFVKGINIKTVSQKINEALAAATASQKMPNSPQSQKHINDILEIVRGGFDLTQVVSSFDESKRLGIDSNSNMNSASDRNHHALPQQTVLTGKYEQNATGQQVFIKSLGVNELAQLQALIARSSNESPEIRNGGGTGQIQINRQASQENQPTTLNLSVSNDKLTVTDRLSHAKIKQQPLQDDQSSQGDAVVLLPNSYRELVGNSNAGENKSHSLKNETKIENQRTGLIKKLSMSPIKSHNFALKQISVTAVSPRGQLNQSSASPKRGSEDNSKKEFILLNDQTVNGMAKQPNDLVTLEHSNSHQKLLMSDLNPQLLSDQIVLSGATPSERPVGDIAMIEKISLKMTASGNEYVQYNASRQLSAATPAMMNQDLPNTYRDPIGETSLSRRDTSREMVLQSIKYREAKKASRLGQRPQTAQPTPPPDSHPISVIQTYKDHNEKQILAKSYSKLMKNIGEELKNVGPCSLRSYQAANAQATEAKSRSRSRSPGQKGIMNNNVSGSQSGGIELIPQIIGVQPRATRTVNGGPRSGGVSASSNQWLRPISPSFNQSNHPQTASQGTRFRNSVKASHIEGLTSQQARPKSSIAREKTPPEAKNDGQTKHKQTNSWQQWPQQRPFSNYTKESDLGIIEEVGASQQRANIIVETLAKNNTNTSRIFITNHSGANIPTQTDRFIRRNLGINSRKTLSMSGLANQQHQTTESGFINPQQLAGLECIVKVTTKPGIRNIQEDPKSNSVYNGIFSSKNFEIVVPNNPIPSKTADKLITLGQHNTYDQQQTIRPMTGSVGNSFTRARGGSNTIYSQPVYGNQTRALQSMRTSVAQLINTTTAGPNSNKFKVFQKLKKGTVFRDEDFQAKKPDINKGFKVTNRY